MCQELSESAGQRLSLQSQDGATSLSWFLLGTQSLVWGTGSVPAQVGTVGLSPCQHSS